MKGFLKFAALGTAMGLLGLINVVMLGRPLDLRPISNENSAPRGLFGQEVSDGESGTGHIEELTFVQTFSRPLFNADRRKYQPPEPPPTPEPPPDPPKVVETPAPEPEIAPPTFRLIGVSVSGSSARALILDGRNRDPQWVLEGEAIEGWVLEKVLDGAIKVSQSGAEFSIDLYPEIR